MTDGRLGPSGRLVHDALDAARDGCRDPLDALAQTHDVSLDFDVCRRATIIADTPGFDTLIDNAADRTVGLFPNVSGALEAEERSVGVVLEILRIVVGRSGESAPDARTISRVEIIELISDMHEYAPTATWSNNLKKSFTEAIQRTPLQGINLACLVDRPPTSAGSGGAAEVQLSTVAGTGRIPLLSGPTGSGKTRILLHTQAAAARDSRIVIVVDAEGYLPKRLGSLIARGINAPQFVGAYSATGLRALKDPEVIVVIDGVSEIPSDARTSLAVELRQLLTSDKHCSLVLAGRDGIVLRSVLPTHTHSMPVVVEPLNRTHRVKLLSAIVGDGTVDPGISKVVAQVERALGGAADNPQLFLVGVKLVFEGHEFTNPASMYQTYVRDTAEQNGYPGVTVLEAGLGIAFASLADKGRRYCDSIEWTEELQRAATMLHNRGDDVTVRDLRLFGFESGLVVRSTGDTVRALHDSFADYLAAVAYWRKLSSLPSTLAGDDRARIEFYAELAGTEAALGALVARDVPFLVPKLSLREKPPPDPASWYAATRGYVVLLWPADQIPPRIAYWSSADRLMVTLDGEIEGWVGERSIDDVGADALTFHAERGPLSVAARIWQYRLREILGKNRRSRVSVPTTEAETVAVLKQYSSMLAQSMQELIRQIAPIGHEKELKDAVGATRMQFLLSGDGVNGTQRDRPLRFRYVGAQTESAVIQEADTLSDDKWTGRGRVDSFIATDTGSEAREIFIRVINILAGIKWL